MEEKIDYKLAAEQLRTGDGLCPMETLCLNVNDPKEAFEKILRKFD